MQRLSLYSLCLATNCFFAAAVMADTPNLAPGLWTHTTTSTIEGPVSFPAQTETHQECLKQDDLDKGLDLLDLPDDCAVSKADISHDRMDFAMQCNVEGMQAKFTGHATFHGNRMQGQMSSDMDTPMGKMQMNMNYTAERVGDC
ncbi:MAG: DUF3617 family protein [Methylophaga sp.]|nr:DUF3617 family protein [Methylophaga sp.]